MLTMQFSQLITSPNRSKLNNWQKSSRTTNTSKFIRKNISYRFEISHLLVSDNGRQFDNKKVKNLCEELGIKKHFSPPITSSKWLGKCSQQDHHVYLEKETWHIDMSMDGRAPQLLQSIPTMSHTAIGKTSFSIAYGAEAMSPVELGLPSPRHINFN